MNKKIRKIISLVLFSCCLAPVAWAQTNSQLYQMGVDAFRSADYAAAARHFERAREAGMNTTSLRYNLGSTYFKLERFAEAEDLFASISTDPTWGVTATYNLGLIAERQGEDDRARAHFQLAYDRANTESIRSRAASKLGMSTPSATPGWVGYLSLAGGFDDRASSLADLSPGSNLGKNDQFLSLGAAASRYLSGSYRDGYRFTGAIYLQDYQDADQFDINVASLALDRDRQFDLWHNRISVRLDNYWLHNDLFGRRLALDYRASRNLNDWRLQLKTGLGYWDAGSGFDFIGGWQTRLGLEGARVIGARVIRLGYRLELNDREDRSINGDFYSYSPLRNLFFAEVRQDMGDLSLTARGDFESSAYGDANVVGTEAVERDDERLKISLRGAYLLGRDWRVFGEYSFTDRKSNIDQYDYENNQVLFGIERSF